jgi:hypothetical protein
LSEEALSGPTNKGRTINRGTLIIIVVVVGLFLMIALIVKFLSSDEQPFFNPYGDKIDENSHSRSAVGFAGLYELLKEFGPGADRFEKIYDVDAIDNLIFVAGTNSDDFTLTSEYWLARNKDHKTTALIVLPKWYFEPHKTDKGWVANQTLLVSDTPEYVLNQMLPEAAQSRIIRTTWPKASEFSTEINSPSPTGEDQIQLWSVGGAGQRNPFDNRPSDDDVIFDGYTDGNQLNSTYNRFSDSPGNQLYFANNWPSDSAANTNANQNNDNQSDADQGDTDQGDADKDDSDMDDSDDHHQDFYVIESIVGTPRGLLVGRIESNKLIAYLVSDPDVANNMGLARGQNAVFSLELIRYIIEREGLTGGVSFYEPKYFDFDSDFGGLFFGPLLKFPMVIVTILSVIAALIFWLAVSKRFGGVGYLATEVSFGKSKLIDNSARLMARTNLLPSVLKAYQKMTIQWAEKTLHAPRLPNEDSISWLDRAASSKGVKINLAATIAQGRQALLNNSEKDMIDCALKLYRFREELEIGPSRSGDNRQYSTKRDS